MRTWFSKLRQLGKSLLCRHDWYVLRESSSINTYSHCKVCSKCDLQKDHIWADYYSVTQRSFRSEEDDLKGAITCDQAQDTTGALTEI